MIHYPAGPVQTLAPWGQRFGISWADIEQWARQLADACAEFAIPEARAVGHVVIESQGKRTARQVNQQYGTTYGLLQVNAGLHKALIERLAGRTFRTADEAGQALIDAPSLALRAGCAVLGDGYRQHLTWDKASSAFFLGNPRWEGQDSENDNTGPAYRASLNGLIAEVEAVNVADNWTPVIYDLANSAHAARFGLTAAQAATIHNKKITNRNGRGADAIEAIGLHVQDGYTSGSLTHWLGVSASSTIMVQQDGSLLRVIPEVDGPWTQGDVNSPDSRARKLLDRYGWDPNVWSLTIEAEDARTLKINAAQERTIAWQIREWQRKYPKLAAADWADRVLGHYEINAVNKAGCGKYRDAMVSSLLAGGPELPNTPAYQGLPAWLTPAALEAAFELADPTGVVTRAIIAWAAETGRTPWFEGKTDLGNNRNIWKFEDVTLFNEGSKVWREGKAA